MRAPVPARPGADFTRLWTASAVSNIGDGVSMVAGPMLVASLTRDPAAVAGAAFAQQLPWLLFALVSGAWADRLDRRRLVVAVNLCRAATMLVLTAAVATGAASLPLLYAVFFVLGVAETLADTASASFVPAIVPADRLPAANSLLTATFTVANQFAAKPLGAALFVLSAALPFGVNAASFLASAALIAGIRTLGGSPARSGSAAHPAGPLPGACPAAPSSPAGAAPSSPASPAFSASPASPAGAAGRRSLRADVAEGVRWLWRHRLLRTLAVTMAFGNLVFCAAFAIFVLYSADRLGLSGVGYGVLLTAFAGGGLAGTLVAPALLRIAGATTLLRAGLFAEVALHATLAATTVPLVAAAMIVVFGVHTVVWGVVATTIRQRAVPSELFGRVTGVYSLVDVSGAALGSLLGGVVAQAYGLVATFWTAAAAMGVVAVCAWRPLGAATGEFRTPR